MQFSVFQITRIGGRRKNEDRMGYTYTRGAAIFLVADGLGGHPHGEVAAQIAMQAVMSFFHQKANPKLPSALEFLHAAFTLAHEQLWSYALDHGMEQTPSTTLVVTVLQDDRCYTAHCGDSRLYLVRNRAVLFRTVDHSVLMRQLASGIDPSRPIANRHALFSCLGAPKEPLIDLAEPIELLEGDRLLLCSDGLWGSLEEQDIVGHLADQGVSESAFALTELALRQGGPHGDNVTLVTVAWERVDNPQPA